MDVIAHSHWPPLMLYMKSFFKFSPPYISAAWNGTFTAWMSTSPLFFQRNHHCLTRYIPAAWSGTTALLEALHPHCSKRYNPPALSNKSPLLGRVHSHCSKRYTPHCSGSVQPCCVEQFGSTAPLLMRYNGGPGCRWRAPSIGWLRR